MTGRVDPGQSETISVKATWHQIVRNTQAVLNNRYLYFLFTSHIIHVGFLSSAVEM